MPSVETLFVVTLAGLALSASPGPSMLYVLSRSIGQSRNAGLASAAGLATGGVVHVIAAVLGLSAIFAYSDLAYSLAKILGAVYLIYLGIDMLLSNEKTDARLEKVRRTPLPRIFYQGILVEVLNPKTVLFFMAFLPQFVDREGGSVALQMLILGALVPLTALPSDLIVAFTGGTIAEKIAANQTLNNLLKCLGGIFLIVLGVRIFTQ